MKKEIEKALSAEYKGLGLSEKTIGRLADYIVGKGSVTKEEEIDAAVKGDDVKQLKDGWTVVTASGSLSAHFEHAIAITPDGPVILTEP